MCSGYAQRIAITVVVRPANAAYTCATWLDSRALVFNRVARIDAAITQLCPRITRNADLRLHITSREPRLRAISIPNTPNAGSGGGVADGRTVDVGALAVVGAGLAGVGLDVAV